MANYKVLLEEVFENYPNTIKFAEDYWDKAIIGYVDVGDEIQLVYDFDKMVKGYVKANKSTYIDAVEWIEYNTIRALPYYPNSPIIMYPAKIK